MDNFKEKNSLQLTEDKLTIGADDPFLPHLIHAINHATEIEITVSFIQPSGLALLFDALAEALKNGAILRLITSDYLDITHPKALRELMTLVDRGALIKVFESKHLVSFHMKSYIFIKTHQDEVIQGCAFIGSSNISRIALTSGLEWNLRHDFAPPKNSQQAQQFFKIKDAFNSLFTHQASKVLSHEWIDEYCTRRKVQKFVAVSPELDIEPNEEVVPRDDQMLALNALKETREQGFQRGLVVLATGMGKTWLSAFDVKQFEAKKVLFVAHREEILLQAQRTFAQILAHKTGFYNAATKNKNADCIFASVQSIGKLENITQFEKSAFDYIIVDEFHHASAPSYRLILNYFQPLFLLGLTATPERTDQSDILSLCDNNLVFERTLTQGIGSNSLVPFKYYGIWDENVDYEAIPWRNGRFDPSELENKFATEKRAKHALGQWEKFKQKRTLAFCISTKHADYMAEFFNKSGIKALSVHSKSSVRRNEALNRLNSLQVDVLFTVDLFNEGTDLPSIDTVMMLRPSESKILFLQQLGRGLRLFEDKTHLVVLDFIGNHHSFLNKPFALFKADTVKSLVKQIKQPELPEGCFVDYDLRLVEFWEKLSRIQKSTVTEDVQELSELLGHFPSASEFFYHFGDLKKVNTKYNGWFDLIGNTEGVDPEKQANANLLSRYHDFLNKGIQSTSMTKSFKAILLEAFVKLDGFKTPPKLELLAIESAFILKRYPHILQHDVKNDLLHAGPDSKAWLNYWKSNPIKAYSTKNKDGSQWFVVENDNFKFNDEVELEFVSVLESAVLELTELALAKYSARIKAEQLNHRNHSEPETKIKELEDKVINIDSNKEKLLYFPNLKIACGHFKTGEESEAEYIAAPEGSGKVDSNKHFFARASGNSMNGGKNPILDGDLLLLEFITPDSAGSLQNQTVAIERQDDAGDSQYLLRDIKKVTDEYGTPCYQLIAKNPEYEVLIADENMKSFARLKHVVRNIG
ncbi:DEAD/DEAH box helicase [Pseudoalteromonas phenolica]|uniref:DEAD/DEAH box helicase n=1 Tax=Pseudoalteromonas phenolica TaxID=161398 RepID=A0A5R9PWT0_9GAMM|nr:DEAD/DEAH box helicase family protein [Pseudoalteromonas phenolica]TLX45105.1 DEAD/DEAH box helicase [Pseudoalteromonas phenolica]